MRKRWIIPTLVIAALVATSLMSCSPLYVIRAGWEEAGILWRREDIKQLTASPDIDPQLKSTLELVLSAREFAESLGLKPKGSFTQYSEIDRDVLVWVLSACPKTSLSPKTWWFPIVGRVPYKGFFEKEEGVAEAKRLQAEGYDIFLRPSPAFSTLGWFDDPFLSTMKNFDRVALVNTVIHEILHNTVWIPNHATFNESLANVVGALGAIEYFRAQGEAGAANLAIAENRWHDEKLFAQFLEELSADLNRIYAEQSDAEKKQKLPSAEIVAKRDQLFAEAKVRWGKIVPQLAGQDFRDIGRTFNNAVIIAQRIYLDRISLFSDLIAGCNRSAACLIEESKKIEKDLKSDGKLTPFTALARRAAELSPTS